METPCDIPLDFPLEPSMFRCTAADVIELQAALTRGSGWWERRNAALHAEGRPMIMITTSTATRTNDGGEMPSPYGTAA